MKKLYSFILIMFLSVITGCGFFNLKETSELDNTQITNHGFITKMSLENSECTLDVTASSSYYVYKYEANVIAYDEFGNVIADDIYGTTTSTTKFEKDEQVIISCEISESVYNNLDTIEVEFTGWAYVSDNEGLIATYRVNFILNNGSDDVSIKVNKGETVSIEDPYLINKIFDAWYSDSSCTNEFDMSTPITSNMNLYANYITDEEAYIKYIKEEILSANITVTTENSKISGGIKYTSTSTGSGVIFHETSNYYYFLTNNHVTAPDTSYTTVNYIVMDYKFVNYSDVTILHSEADYDLSVGRFKKGSAVLEVITMQNSNPIANDELIAIGQPLGVTNTVTLGTVTSYVKVTTSDSSTSNISFPVIKHTAETNNGSSGGGIFNSDFELIAIAYAGSTDSNGNFLSSYAIPIEKVHEFLNAYFWTLTLI